MHGLKLLTVCRQISTREAHCGTQMKEADWGVNNATGWDCFLF
jgi:hypothetical protein